MASFSVSPSPYNPVKLELGVWLVFCVPVWLTIRAFNDVELTRLLLLAGYSAIAALRLLWRVQRVQAQIRQSRIKDTEIERSQAPARSVDD